MLHKPDYNLLPLSNVAMSPGTVIRGRYRIDEMLGEGGMGRVYRAWDIDVSRQIAIKQLVLQMDSDNTEITERFRREYHFLNSIDHPNLVKAYDLFSYEGQLFLVLEFIAGISLKKIIQEQPFSLSLLEQIAIGNQLGRAIHVLNTAGIIHRDVKPGNIMLNSETGRVTLLDLGLGKSVGKEEWALTQKGVVVGTLEYLSPEQACGSVSAQSDVFSVGITLYQFFLWEPSSPFKSHGGVATIMEITTRDLPLLVEQIEHKFKDRNLELPRAWKESYEELSKILARALEKEPEKRPTAGELADELERIHKKLSLSKSQSVSPESTNYQVSMRVDVKQMEQLQRLGEKYGKDRLISRRMGKRARKSKSALIFVNLAGLRPYLYVLPLIAILILLVVAGWFYSMLGSSNQKLIQISQKLEESEKEKQAVSQRLKLMEDLREEEYQQTAKFHESLVDMIEYSKWGKYYGQCAAMYQTIQRYEDAIKTYQQAIAYSDPLQKDQYRKEIQKLQKKLPVSSER